MRFLSEQRDLYGYLHDQSVRLMNRGLTGAEIAEVLELPPPLADRWHTRGYYGSLSHNAKAVYQRYMGWYDANPAHLWPHPPEAAAVRYVEAMGGAEAVLERARASFSDGDYRWAAEVVNHVIFADPDNEAARELQAATFEQLAYGAENATWRNVFLMGARELRDGPLASPAVFPPDLLSRLTISQMVDTMAVRIDGPAAWGVELRINLTLGDPGERYLLRLVNGVLTHVVGRHDPEADATIAMPRDQFVVVVLGLVALSELVESGIAQVDGDIGVIDRLRDLVDRGDPLFGVVTP